MFSVTSLESFGTAERCAFSRHEKTATCNRVGLSLSLSVCLFFILPGGLATAQEPHAGFDSDRAMQDEVRILAKRFYLSMKQANIEKLREIIDPVYLTENHLDDARLNSRLAPATNLYAVHLAADKQTVLCQIEGSRESVSIVLLRIIDRDGKLYLVPPHPPVGKTEQFTPWLLHTTLTVGNAAQPQ